jgi:N-acetylglucosamine repressor
MEGIKRRIIDHTRLSDHEKKNLLILETIRRKGPVARADISRLVDLNNVTVTSYVDQYLKKGVLQEAGVHISTGGRKPTLVDLDATRAFAIGVGLNMVHHIAVLTNLKGKIIHKVKVDRLPEAGARPVDAILSTIELLIRESGVDVAKIHGVGVGLPGVVNQNNGTVRWPRGLVDQDLHINISVSGQIYDKFKLPAILDNDANTAVFAEQWVSETGLNVDSAVYLYSGSGCGFLIDGHIYRGHTGSAGEFLFDLTREDPVGWVSEAAKSGSWTIDLGIALRARQELAQHPDSVLHRLCGGQTDQIHLQMVAEAAGSGDAFASALLSRTGAELGRKAALLVNLINPELIIIGGGIEAAGIILLDAVRQRIRECAIPEAAEKTKVVPSRLGEDAVPLGAAALVIQNCFIMS